MRVRLGTVAVFVLIAHMSAEARSAPSRRLAVLTLANGIDLPESTAAYLTDRVREVALSATGPRLYVITRENLLDSLPPGADLAICDNGCEIETGRNVGADYVVTGEIVALGKHLGVSLKLHETAKGALVAMARGGADNIEGLDMAVTRAASELLTVFAAPPARALTLKPICDGLDPTACERACGEGDAGACNTLGSMYELGEGVRRNRRQSATFYDKACELGLTVGCSHRARLRPPAGSQPWPEVVPGLYGACDGGDSRACADLARRYEVGDGVHRDLVEAAALYRRACDGGMGVACSHWRRIERR